MKKNREQNCWSQEDIQIINFGPFFNWTRSFRFNRKERYQK